MKSNKYPQTIVGVLLAQAKNGDEHFWNIEISCSQWEGSACTQSALIFFFQVWGAKRIFFKNSFVPKHVPFKFPMGSHQVPNVFPKGVSTSTSL